MELPKIIVSEETSTINIQKTIKNKNFKPVLQDNLLLCYKFSNDVCFCSISSKHSAESVLFRPRWSNCLLLFHRRAWGIPCSNFYSHWVSFNRAVLLTLGEQETSTPTWCLPGSRPLNCCLVLGIQNHLMLMLPQVEEQQSQSKLCVQHYEKLYRLVLADLHE